MGGAFIISSVGPGFNATFTQICKEYFAVLGVKIEEGKPFQPEHMPIKMIKLEELECYIDMDQHPEKQDWKNVRLYENTKSNRRGKAITTKNNPVRLYRPRGRMWGRSQYASRTHHRKND